MSQCIGYSYGQSQRDSTLPQGRRTAPLTLDVPTDAWLTWDHHLSRIAQGTVSEDCCLRKAGMSVTLLVFLTFTRKSVEAISPY